MIIYLEGPDGSGKSTLSDKLVEVLMKHDKQVYQVKDGNCAINTHPKKADRNTLNELYLALVTMAYDDEKIYVLDRGPVSDIIYRHFDNYKPVANEKSLIKLFEAMNIDNKIIIIMCLTDVAEQKMLERGDDNPIAIAKHKEITKQYKAFMPALDTWQFDYTKITADKFANLIYNAHFDENIML